HAPAAKVYEQAQRRGTADAVLAAKAAFATPPDDTLVLYVDTPLVSPETLLRMRQKLADGADIVVLGFRPENPAGYGRLVMSGERLTAIREDKDAAPGERAIGLCNAGVMAFRGGLL